MIVNSVCHAQVSECPQTMPEYPDSPAPSPKAIWHAEETSEWAMSYASYLHENAMHGTLKVADLVELKTAAGKQPDRWYPYADSFGLLVTMVANLLY